MHFAPRFCAVYSVLECTSIGVSRRWREGVVRAFTGSSAMQTLRNLIVGAALVFSTSRLMPQAVTLPHDAIRSQADCIPKQRLNDGSQPLLVDPAAIWEDRSGRYVVPDASERDVKLYSRNGTRVATLGSAGVEAGQFSSVVAAQPYVDSIVAYDLVRATISVFNPRGSLVRTVKIAAPRPADVRVIDDSLWLVIASTNNGFAGDLLRIVRPDGSLVASFFNRSAYFANLSALVQAAHVNADARAGRVYAWIGGDDTLFVF